MSVDKYTGSTDIRFYPLNSANAENPCFRFLDKDKNECEREWVSNTFREQINLYGTQITYFVNTYNPAYSADNFYGEQPLSPYGVPISFIGLIDLNENSLMLTKYGFQSDDEITLYIHISSFYEAYHKPALSGYFHGYSIEPKSGDVFKLTEYGSDRPGERDGKMFEITERLDQDINKINPLLGHYVWLLKAKRYETSFEPGLTAEKGNTQVFDDAQGQEDSTGAEKVYPEDVDELSKDVFNGSTDNDVYGGYDDYIINKSNIPITPTKTPTQTPTPPVTPSFTPTPSVTPSHTPTNTITPTKTPTPTPFALYGEDEAKNYQTPTPTVTRTPTLTPTPSKTSTPTPTPTVTPTNFVYNVEDEAINYIDPVYTYISFNGQTANINPQGNYVIVNTNVTNFTITFGTYSVNLDNYFTPGNLFTSYLSANYSSGLSANKTNIYYNTNATISADNNLFYTLYYYNTGSLILGFSYADRNLPSIASYPPFPTPTPTTTITPTTTPTNTITPSVTPTNTSTPQVTPSNTVTPSVTPTVTRTPTLTPTPTVTPEFLSSLAKYYIGTPNIFDFNKNYNFGGYFTSGSIGAYQAGITTTTVQDILTEGYSFYIYGPGTARATPAITFDTLPTHLSTVGSKLYLRLHSPYRNGFKGVQFSEFGLGGYTVHTFEIKNDQQYFYIRNELNLISPITAVLDWPYASDSVWTIQQELVASAAYGGIVCKIDISRNSVNSGFYETSTFYSPLCTFYNINFFAGNTDAFPIEPNRLYWNYLTAFNA